MRNCPYFPPGRADGGASTEQEKEQPGTMDDGLDVVKEGWFTELSSMWPGQGLSLEVKEILFRQRSKFQVSAQNALVSDAIRTTPETKPLPKKSLPS